MKKTEEKVVHYKSDEAATIQTLTGWVSREGRYWGKDEHMARWEGCTHTDCKECGALIPIRSYTICENCMDKKQVERYNVMPFREWDEDSFVYSETLDKYFQDSEAIEYELDNMDEPIDSKDLRLVLCEPNYLHEVDMDQWSDIFPEDDEPNLTKEFEEKLKELNAIISKHPPVSWSAGKFRTNWSAPKQ